MTQLALVKSCGRLTSKQEVMIGAPYFAKSVLTDPNPDRDGSCHSERDKAFRSGSLVPVFYQGTMKNAL
jgi:hypothetical protein